MDLDTLGSLPIRENIYMVMHNATLVDNIYGKQEPHPVSHESLISSKIANRKRRFMIGFELF